MRIRFVPAVLICSLVLVGCSTKVDLKYAKPSTAILAGSGAPRLEIGSFVDQRGVPANWLGAIRGGFGNPFKNLETSVPVNRIVEMAFADSLESRRFAIAPGSASIRVSGVIKRLDCNQMVQREANVEIVVTVTGLATGRQSFSQTYSATNYEGAGLRTGLFGSPDALRMLTERTLQEVVNKALDDSALRNALHRGTPYVVEDKSISNVNYSQNLVLGKTTKQDVLRDLGQPIDSGFDSSGKYECWEYLYRTASSSTALGEKGNVLDKLILEFDNKGILRGLNFP